MVVRPYSHLPSLRYPNAFYRTFSKSVNEDEYVWHRDENDRTITVLSKRISGWQLQLEDQLPVDLVAGKKFFVPAGVYHRLIKGKGDLSLFIQE